MVVGSDIIVTARELIDTHVPHLVSPLILISELQRLVGTCNKCVETFLSFEVLSIVPSDLNLIEEGVLTRGERHPNCTGNKCRNA